MRKVCLLLALAFFASCANSNGGNGDIDAAPQQPIDAQTIPDAIPKDAGAQTFGDPCARNPDCTTGYCVQTPGDNGGVCSQTCNNDCPSGWDCKPVTLGDGSTQNLCIPVNAILCFRCTAEDQCPGGGCLHMDGDDRCASSCNDPSDCPSGYTCAPDAEGTHTGMYCQPDTGSCTCDTATNGTSRSCAVTNGVGTCWGTQTCDGAVGWSGCTARTPAPETCNGVDDDCNFVIDDGVGGGEDCTISNGFGSCPGVRQCEGASGFGCVGQTPAGEKCNFLDDDCDGTADEDFAPPNGNLGNLCSAGIGACLRYGSYQCTPDGLGTQCSAVAGASSPELCNGLDDNCNNQVDETFPTLGNACIVGQGVCQRQGTVICSTSDPTQTACSATAGTGTPTETCNYLDDNCNGQVDEGFKNQATGQYDQAQTCGSCAIDCTQVYAGAHWTGACSTTSGSPQCTLSCSTGYFDLDNDTSDGCEFQLRSDTIYVSKDDPSGLQGDDNQCGMGPVGTGTGNHPCASISKGISQAIALGRSRIQVADATYDEAVQLQNGRSLFGGYFPATWLRHAGIGTATSADQFSTATVIDGVYTPTGSNNEMTVYNTATISSATTFEGFSVRGATNSLNTAANGPAGNSYAMYLVNTSTNLHIQYNQIFSGRGAPGRLGSAGTQGTGGAPGTAGAAAIFYSGTGLCSSDGSTVRASSGGGTTVVAGGNGGGNECVPSPNNQHSALAASAGSGTGGGTAGLRGYDALFDNNGCIVPADASGNTLPQYGTNGGTGSGGSSGSAGGGCTSNGGQVVSDNWQGFSGGGGGTGTNAAGGGGGGAGGGSQCTQTGTGACTKDQLGGHGGGGGGAGGGGGGGTGGTPGGSAFAIFVSRGTAPSISVNQITLGGGGNGGPGGIGGAGGRGGVGAAGGTVPVGTGQPNCSGQGGRGGDGGNGGAGGGGGGGCGGNAYGIFTSQLGSSMTYCTASNNAYSGGVAGSGGTGGFSSGNSGTTGASGVNPTTTSCSFN